MKMSISIGCEDYQNVDKSIILILLVFIFIAILLKLKLLLCRNRMHGTFLRGLCRSVLPATSSLQYRVRRSAVEMKYILVTGGVISGVGKGVIASSFGTILKCSNIHVTSIKIDPYINIDAGTFSPYEHGN
jgi:hypothetical protein